MRSLALLLTAAALSEPPDASPDRVQDYSGVVTGSGIEKGRITIHVASTELVTGALTGRVDGRHFNVALHGKVDKQKLTLVAQPETASVKDLRFTVDPMEGGYRGTLDGELYGKPVLASFEARTTHGAQSPPEKTNGH